MMERIEELCDQTDILHKGIPESTSVLPMMKSCSGFIVKHYGHYYAPAKLGVVIAELCKHCVPIITSIDFCTSKKERPTRWLFKDGLDNQKLARLACDMTDDVAFKGDKSLSTGVDAMEPQKQSAATVRLLDDGFRLAQVI